MLRTSHLTRAFTTNCPAGPAIQLFASFAFSLLCCAATNAQTQHAEKSQPPNVVFLLADDLGYNDLSCYRKQFGVESATSSKSQTPCIDRLAQSGILFSDFYCGAAVCSPSRAALQTGINKTRLGIHNWIPANSPMHLESRQVTLGETLQANNYQTAHFGKWHLTSAGTEQPGPNEQGYDFAFWTHNNALPSHRNPTNFILGDEDVGELKGYSSHIVADRAIDWLKTERIDNKPFFLNVCFHEPHTVVAAPDNLVGKYKDTKHPVYYACIENMDSAVGKIMAYLESNGMLENTIIMFSSDNGSAKTGSNFPFRGEKCFQFEGGIRVPFIVSWKDQIPDGKTSTALGHFTDVMPTIAKFTNTRLLDENIDGIDISPVLLGKKESVDRPQPLFFYRYFHDPVCMVREGDFVLLGYVNAPKQKVDDINEVQEALFQPKPGADRWSAWGFSENHMNAIRKQKISFYELYQIRADIGQSKDVQANNPKTLERLKNHMTKTRSSWLEEGDRWFEN